LADHKFVAIDLKYIELFHHRKWGGAS